MKTGSQSLIRIGGLAGIITPVLFTILVIAESLLRPGYSQISDEISSLGVGQYQIIQNLNFIFSGALSILFGLGLGTALISNTSRRSAKITRGTVIVFAFGIIFAGITLILAGQFRNIPRLQSNTIICTLLPVLWLSLL